MGKKCFKKFFFCGFWFASFFVCCLFYLRTASLFLDKEQVIKKLESALKEIKTMKGLLPICSFCKKIRNDTGYWEQLEQYVSSHSEAEFTHSMCPECLERLYPEIHDKLKK